MDDKILGRVASLLRQAESTKNAHEAEAFMEAAQRIASANSISLAVARAHQADKEKREQPIQKHIAIGTSGKKGLKYYVRLFLAIAHQNDVRCDISSNSTAVWAYGFPSDIEMVELLYSSLIVQMIEASERFIRSGAYKNETVERFNEKTYRYEQKPVDGRVARANFQTAFISAISIRMQIARMAALEEAKANEPKAEQESSSTAIVLRNKEIEIRDFYEGTSNARGSWGGWRGSSGGSSVAATAGRQAGESARLGGQRAIGGGQRQIKGN